MIHLEGQGRRSSPSAGTSPSGRRWRRPDGSSPRPSGQAAAAPWIEKNRDLSRSEARYRRLTEGSHDAVVVADGEGRITLFNPAAERTFGYQADEVRSAGRSHRS